MDVPPSRYRVVETGRRLVVIDTLARPGTARPAPAPMRANLTRSAEALRAAPYPVFTTSKIYDAKAPRRVVVDERNGKRLGAAIGLAVVLGPLFAVLVLSYPALLALGLPLLHVGVQHALRAASTAWLDTMAQADADSSEG